MKKAENENALKNLINQDVVRLISSEIKRIHPQFDSNVFNKVSESFDNLEFRDRAVAIGHSLKSHLPNDYKNALNILIQVIKNKKLSGFSLWAFSEFIGHYGVDHFDESMKAMYFLTQQFTAEFAVRPFLLKDPNKVLSYFNKWSKDSNVHVRRWVSEGTRPYLPWGLRLNIFKEQPEFSLNLLEQLKYDSEIYVRKSVANHLNDLSKLDPQLVIRTLDRWEKASPLVHQEKIQWIKRHSLRTLIKKGHPEALGLMGVSSKAEISVKRLSLKKSKIRLGDKLTFTFEIRSQSKKEESVILDYVIHFKKSNGKTSGKVFKLKTLKIKSNETIQIEKNHLLKPITTMKFYSGIHYISIKVNGHESEKLKWLFKTI